jgi:hypothetical protein
MQKSGKDFVTSQAASAASGITTSLPLSLF